MDEVAKFLAAIIGLAIIAVLVSQNAQTASVFQAFASGISQIIGAAVAPVTGSSTSGNLGLGTTTSPSYGGGY